MESNQLKGIIKSGYKSKAVLNKTGICFKLDTLTDKELEKCGISIPKKKASISANMANLNITGSITTNNLSEITLTGNAEERDWGRILVMMRS